MTTDGVRLEGLEAADAVAARRDVASLLRHSPDLAIRDMAETLTISGPTIVVAAADDSHPRAIAWFGGSCCVWAIGDEGGYMLERSRAVDAPEIIVGILGLFPRLDDDPPDEPLVLRDGEVEQWLADGAGQSWTIRLVSPREEVEPSANLRFVDRRGYGWFVATDEVVPDGRRANVLMPVGGRVIWQALNASVGRMDSASAADVA